MSHKSFMPNWRGIASFLADKQTDWKPKALVVVSILYLVIPIDFIPDFIPLAGWLDDVGLASVAMWYLTRATNRYLDREKR